jgi:outer membrane protein
MQNKNLTLLVSMLLALLLLSNAVYAENLIDIYDLAKKNDPTFQAAVATQNAAHETVKQSRGEFLPNVGLRAGYSDTAGDSQPFSSTSATTSYSVTLSQPLYNSNIAANHSLNKNFVKQSDADFKSAEQSLIVRVANQYFSVLGAQDNLEFSKAEKNANERQLEQTKQRFEVGLVAITDVHEAQARYDLSVSQLISAENLLNNEVEALRAITGEYHNSLSALQDDTPLQSPEPNDIEKWTKLALEQNQDLISTRYFVEQSRDAVDIQRAGNKPTLDFTTTYSHSDNDDYGTIDTTSYGVQFNMNLFAGGTISANIQQAQYNLTRAMENLEKARRTTQQTVRSAYLGVLSAISQVKALRQAVISSESRLKASEAGFEVGTRTTVDVLDARRELFNSQREYARSRYDYILQLLKLRQAAGTLSAEDLNRVNNWLQ